MLEVPCESAGGRGEGMRSTVMVTTPALVGDAAGNDDDDDDDTGPPPLPRPLALAPPPAVVSLHFKSLPTPSALSGQNKTKR